MQLINMTLVSYAEGLVLIPLGIDFLKLFNSLCIVKFHCHIIDVNSSY